MIFIGCASIFFTFGTIHYNNDTFPLHNGMYTIPYTAINIDNWVTDDIASEP